MLGRGLESLIPPNQGSGEETSSFNLPENSDSEVIGTQNYYNNVNESRIENLSTSIPSEVSRINTEKVFPKKQIARQASAPAKNSGASGPVFQIEIGKIIPNPLQPRHHFDETALQELANSIREYGVIQPLLVSKIERVTDQGSEVEYQLIAGERRLRASELAGMSQVPVIVMGPQNRKDQLELAIIENLQREDLNSIEAARAFARLQDEFNLTQREISTRLGKSRESIANTLRLLSLPSSIQSAIENGKLNESQGRMLLMVSHPGEQERIFTDLLNNKLTVRELRKKIKSSEKPQSFEPKEDEVELLDEYEDPEVVDLKEQLETFFGAPVTIKKQGVSGASGKIVIDFFSPEELRGIALKLAKSSDSDLGDDYGDEFSV